MTLDSKLQQTHVVPLPFHVSFEDEQSKRLTLFKAESEVRSSKTQLNSLKVKLDEKNESNPHNMFVTTKPTNNWD